MPDPIDDSVRYHGLAPLDYAVFAMREAAHQPLPQSISMLLLSRSNRHDAEAIENLDEIMIDRSLAILSVDQTCDLGPASWVLMSETTSEN